LLIVRGKGLIPEDINHGHPLWTTIALVNRVHPRQLKGEEIFMEARILTVDVVEAMASHRPYRHRSSKHRRQPYG
jgi:hypothetical protein